MPATVQVEGRLKRTANSAAAEISLKRVVVTEPSARGGPYNLS